MSGPQRPGPVTEDRGLAVVLWPAPDASGTWPDLAVTARSAAALSGAQVHLAGDPHDCGLGGADVQVLAGRALLDLLHELEAGQDVLLVRAPVQFPADLLDRALAWCREDPRVATVGLLHTGPGTAPVVLPEDGSGPPTSGQVRARLTAHGALPPASVPVNDGPVVLLSATALSTLVSLSADPRDRPGAQLVQVQLAWERKGFTHLLDPAGYVHTPRDTAGWRPEQGGLEQDLAQVARRAPHAVAHAAREADRRDSPGRVALAAVRARLHGLRVGIDGTCLGPLEMGTQTQTLAVVEALSQHDEVAEVVVALGGGVPTYAQRVLHLPGVSYRAHCGRDVTQVGLVDLLHRPFQPHGPLDVGSWRRVAGRCVLTVQDLIAYQVGAYHRDEADRESYRAGLRQAVRDVDGVVAISDDTVRSLERERLPVEAQRVFQCENGTDHLSGGEGTAVPGEMLAPDRVAARFLLVLGADYSHKNRDLAVAAHHRLVEAHGHDVLLVLCGAEVPYGSSRALESRVPREDSRVLDLPDVTSEERNWLLRHAAAVMYPTSNEGFGLVPYEAARFGTPTVLVPFGPLSDLGARLPVVARDWSPEELAAAAASLLEDPRLSGRAVAETLAAATTWSWSRTADRLVDAYHRVLALPPRT